MNFFIFRLAVLKGAFLPMLSLTWIGPHSIVAAVSGSIWLSISIIYMYKCAKSPPYYRAEIQTKILKRFSYMKKRSFYIYLYKFKHQQYPKIATKVLFKIKSLPYLSVIA